MRNRLLEHEDEIEWLRDPEQFDWVRSTETHSQSPTDSIEHFTSDSVTIGYAKLSPDAPSEQQSGAYHRRVFYLRETDSAIGGSAFQNHSPAEAVLPETVEPGLEGVKARPRNVTDTEAKREPPEDREHETYKQDHWTVVDIDDLDNHFVTVAGSAADDSMNIRLDIDGHITASAMNDVGEERDNINSSIWLSPAHAKELAEQLEKAVAAKDWVENPPPE